VRPPPPIGLLAELTHRCPLRCPYCSNPVDLARRSAELDTDTWRRVFREAADLGILHVHLSGGEPTARADIVELTRAATEAGLYTNLITSGVGLKQDRLEALATAGLDHLQLSVQDVLETEADRVAGRRGAHAEKRSVAGWTVAAGLPLTINAVIHRGNIGRIEAIIDEAVALGARRIEIAHAQYYGWGLLNRAALLPEREETLLARMVVERAQARLEGAIVIDYVAPDQFARHPKPCMSGWGRRFIVVTPTGRALPCHAAESIPSLEFWTVRDRSLGDIWERSPAFAAFRGTEWMREPCASCPRKEVDFGGCRCQAHALTGDASNTDPACIWSPGRDAIRSAPPAHRRKQVVYRKYGQARQSPVNRR
jgi:pyrroloquinoline quinone biosynthesis protein E